MKRTLSVILISITILIAAAFSLRGITNTVKQDRHIELMETLLPNGKDFVKVDSSDTEDIIRSVHKASNGYVIETSTRGYADDITMLIGVDNNGVVTGLVAYQSHETLGLGSKILSDHNFLAQFLNKSGTFNLGDTKNEKEISIDGISGATVSSKTVVKCVNAAVAYVTGADIEASATQWEG